MDVREVIITLAVGLLPVVLGLIIEYRTGWFVGGQRKRLSYEIVSSSPLIGSKEGIDGLEVYYKQKPVADLTLLVLKIANTGRVPIVPDDYEGPITIRFSKGNAKILNIDLTETSPNNLKTHVTRR